jgi:PAS domain S-box-containing protein
LNNQNTPARETLDDGRRLRLLIDSVQDFALYLLDSGGKVMTWNAGAERITGYAADEIIGCEMAVLYMSEERDGGRPARAQAAAAAAGRHEEETWHLRKGGSRFWANTVLQALRDDQDDLIGFACITRDISEHKPAGETLVRVNASLSQAQRLEAVGQLTGGIAHDFNNALTVIVNSLDLLAARLRSVSDIVVLEKAQRAAERAAGLNRQLLAFARRQVLMPELQNLNVLIEAAAPLLRRACGPATAIVIEADSGLQTVAVDSQQFEHALLSLVINAQEAMPQGGRLRIATGQAQLDARHPIANLLAGAYATVAVSDTGVGMPPDLAQRAIEPFFTTKHMGMGNGLGLSQVYGFAAQSGGGMTIASEVGKGTTVTLYFPLAADARQRPRPAAAGSGKVLIVEDDPDVLDLSVRIFQSLGFEVLTAGNGLDGVAVLERVRDIDVLFADVVMPMGISGIELARFTRKLCPDVRILLASGYPEAVLNAEHGELGDFAFISKPFRWAELLEKIRRLRGEDGGT